MQLYWRKWTESWEENSMGKDKKVAGNLCVAKMLKGWSKN